MRDRSMDIVSLQEILDDAPFHRLFELEILPCDATDELHIRMMQNAAVERTAGSGQIHGGVLASLGDIAGSFVVGRMLGVGGVTIHLSIDYMRPAIQTSVTAVAKVRRVGRTAAFVDIDITNDSGQVVAACRGIFGLPQQ